MKLIVETEYSIEESLSVKFDYLEHLKINHCEKISREIAKTISPKISPKNDFVNIATTEFTFISDKTLLSIKEMMREFSKESPRLRFQMEQIYYEIINR